MGIGDLVLFKNNQFIAFNKPVGMPVQADKTGDKALIDLASIYCKCQLHLVNRLDRPASGIVLFAKSVGAMTALTAQFSGRTVHKTYLAVVQQLPGQPSGTLVHYIVKNGRSNTARALDQETPGSERAELEYRVVRHIDRYHLLEIDLFTGRHHQIRAQLAAIGCPVKGDVKYGFRRNNADRSIHLHAWKLDFQHPVSGETIHLVAPPPDDPVWNAFNIEE